MVSQTVRGHLHHEAARLVAVGLLSFLSLVGTLLVLNAIGVPPWFLLPSAFTLAVVVGFLLGARASRQATLRPAASARFVSRLAPRDSTSRRPARAGKPSPPSPSEAPMPAWAPGHFRARPLTGLIDTIIYAIT